MSKHLYRVSEVSEQCSLGRTKTYDLINRGVIRAVRVDGAFGCHTMPSTSSSTTWSRRL